MKGVGGKEAQEYWTVVTVDADGKLPGDGCTITFTKPFGNIPCGMVVCVLGTVDLNSQPVSVWTVTCTRTKAVISITVTDPVQSLPANYEDSEIGIGIIVHEQL